MQRALLFGHVSFQRVRDLADRHGCFAIGFFMNDPRDGRIEVVGDEVNLRFLSSEYEEMPVDVEVPIERLAHHGDDGRFVLSQGRLL